MDQADEDYTGFRGSFIFLWLVLAILSPLKLSELPFVIGGLIFVLGQICFVIALYNYKDTPLDHPVTKGLYRISRNPQHVSLFLAFLGVSIAIGSWFATLLILIAIVLGDMRIKAEERACLEQMAFAFSSILYPLGSCASLAVGLLRCC